MLKRQHGVILVSSLFFLMIINLLLLDMWQAVSFEQKMNHYQYRYLLSQQLAEASLRQAYQQLLLGNVPCVLNNMPIEEILQQPASWWQSAQLCQVRWASQVGQFYLTYLQRDDCAMMAKHQVAAYWQITAHATLGQYGQLILQAVVAIPVRQSTPCLSPQRQLHQVWQSFRQLA